MPVSDAVKKAVTGRKFNSLITETFDLALKHESETTSKGMRPFTFVAKDNFALVSPDAIILSFEPFQS